MKYFINKLEMTQDFLKDNFKNLESISLDYNEIVLKFKNKHEIIMYADEADINLIINTKNKEKLNNDV